MPGNDNPHALRLTEAIRSRIGEAEADGFAQAHPLSKSAKPDRKSAWACEVCEDAALRFGTDAAVSIRRACRCSDGRTMAQQILRCLRKTTTPDAACALFTQENPCAFLEYISDDELIFGYRACVCSCVKRAEGPVPLLWCECSAGYAEAMFRRIFGEDVQVELLGSIAAGCTRCEMRVRIT